MRRPQDRIGRKLLNSEAVVPPQWRGMVPGRELWIGPEDSIAHFFGWAYEYRAYLTLLCGLRPDSAVLELGCGHGRTMLGLVGYLDGRGRYEGLDASAPAVEFATGAITALHPQLRFTHADLRSQTYNPGGAVDPATFDLPYEDAAFDVVFAASLFTHLLPEEVANYLAQTARVLRPGGSALLSFFFLDRYRGPGTTAYEFDHALAPGVAALDPDRPDKAIAYSEAEVGTMAAAAGLAVERTLSGYWAGPGEYGVNEQDLVLLRA